MVLTKTIVEFTCKLYFKELNMFLGPLLIGEIEICPYFKTRMKFILIFFRCMEYILHFEQS